MLHFWDYGLFVQISDNPFQLLASRLAVVQFPFLDHWRLWSILYHLWNHFRFRLLWRLDIFQFANLPNMLRNSNFKIVIFILQSLYLFWIGLFLFEKVPFLSLELLQFFSLLSQLKMHHMLITRSLTILLLFLVEIERGFRFMRIVDSYIVPMILLLIKVLHFDLHFLFEPFVFLSNIFQFDFITSNDSLEIFLHYLNLLF